MSQAKLRTENNLCVLVTQVPDNECIMQIKAIHINYRQGMTNTSHYNLKSKSANIESFYNLV